MLQLGAQVLPSDSFQKGEKHFFGICKICLRWWKNNITRGMFKFLEENYGVSRELLKERSWELVGLLG